MANTYNGMPVIDDSTPERDLQPPIGQSTGLCLGLRDELGYAGIAEPFPQELLIPFSEMRARIEERKAQRAMIRDMCLAAGLPCKDQNGTNYCWINAPTHCVEILRVIQNQPMVILSPASAGGPIKNYRNIGGWGKEGLEFIVAYGLVPVDKWPANAIDSRYNTTENRQLARQFRVTEWWELEPGNIHQQLSCLLQGIPYASGRNRWSHETTDVDADWIDGAPAIIGRNSWGMGWGDKGFFVMQGDRMMRSDDSVAPRVAIAS